jgi:DNA repair protein RadD
MTSVATSQERKTEPGAITASPFTPRPYQAELADRAIAALRRSRTAVMQLGTGGGKTATASHIIERAVSKGLRVVFAAHLDTLIEDTAERLAAAGIRAGFVQADRPVDSDAMVQVASLATMHARNERPPADLLIIDECHRSMAPSVLGVIKDYSNAMVLGLTATPQRGDGQPLGPDPFAEIVCGPSNRWLTENGHLVPCDILSPAAPSDALISEPINAYRRDTPNGRAIVFCSHIEHAEWVTYGFRSFGIPTECITGETSRAERAGLKDRITAGTTKVLVGVRVFIEGFDAPAIDTVILARPFGVVGSYLQAIGRGLRPHHPTGKTKCTVLDLRGSYYMHGLPDEDRNWPIDGPPIRIEKIPALMRCQKCLAGFRPAARCPRCGATREHLVKMPRVETRDEKLERVNELPEAERDRRYFMKLVHIASTRMRMPPPRARGWAQTAFQKQKGRAYGAP